MTLRFEWDEAKAAANKLKHGIEFDEELTVFGDSESITLYDEQHSDEEERFIDIGMSVLGRVLVVVYTERQNVVRIISSRLATTNEQEQYEQESG